MFSWNSLHTTLRGWIKWLFGLKVPQNASPRSSLFILFYFFIKPGSISGWDSQPTNLVTTCSCWVPNKNPFNFNQQWVLLDLPFGFIERENPFKLYSCTFFFLVDLFEIWLKLVRSTRSWALRYDDCCAGFDSGCFIGGFHFNPTSP